jgi:hypothetical protein
VPSSINARAGSSTAFTVHVLRRDGFNGPIDLALLNAPAGYSLSGGRIPAGQQKARMTLTAPAEPGADPVVLHLQGTATVQGAIVKRQVVPADDMMQAFYYHHLVPAQEWMVGFVGRGRGGFPFRFRGVQEVKVPSGGTALLHFVGPHGPVVKTAKFSLSEPPEGLTVQKTAFTDDGLDIVLRADPAKLKAGWKGNVIVDVSMERVSEPRPGQPKPVTRRIPVGSLPAVPIEIVAK